MCPFRLITASRFDDLAPALNCIRACPVDKASALEQTDVFSFHADSAPVAADTWLCTYHGAPNKGLRNAEARLRIDGTDTRRELLACYGGDDDDGFIDGLRENCQDLHYAPTPDAQPYSFGLFNLCASPSTIPAVPARPAFLAPRRLLRANRVCR